MEADFPSQVTKIKKSRNRKELRKGYTTGACATAASLGALSQLLTNESISTIQITLPTTEQVTFNLQTILQTPQQVTCYVIKDAGDDPDCTDKAHITTTVSLTDKPGITFVAGNGVATVTLPGLELAVGEPAINPVPRKMIREHLLPLLAKYSQGGARVEISVPNGEKMAEESIAKRLGLIGGISILGTRGTVFPYSTSAYSASIRQNIMVAKAQGLDTVYLTTGSRTEKAAMEYFPQQPELAFVQVGDFSGVGLRAAARYEMKHVELVTMIGKLCKLTAGNMLTHVSGRAINFNHLADIAATMCKEQDVDAIRHALTGRHLLQMKPPLPDAFFEQICLVAAKHCIAYAHHSYQFSLRLVDFNGATIARVTLGEKQ
ncbi:cobalt-precorrin-5B (C(1))-methyltransferase [Shewanella livingstonensis]|uniref:Cobalt-precorrin-5B C(1)-methyltransferase n=2 Tax=Shewanella livingstonensis TaxID=150120 RepID=A0A3G8LZN3_9GAMM|nr:cobalt-precorrin-5B (C(1))-methyltransferase [Shewanella livingstonensis]